MRDSMIFYRSFYEAIKQLPKEEQADIYDAIFKYGLDFQEPELSGVAKTIYTLIKPQIDANIKRYQNGLQPKEKQEKSKKKAKHKQTKSKTETNNNDNDNLNEECKSELEEEIKIHPLQTYVKEKFSRVTKLEKQLTYEECEKLLSKYPREKIASVLMSMENYKKITDKVSVYLTILKWIEKDNSKPNQDEAVLPPKKELKEIPASAIFTEVKIDYGNFPPPHER